VAFKAITNELYSFIDCIPGGVVTFVQKDQHPFIEITAWNKVITEITGYNFEEISQKGFLDIIINGEEKSKLSKILIDDMFDMNCKVEKHIEIMTKDRIRKEVSINLSILDNGDKFDKRNFIALVKDITIERIKEQELEEIEDRYKRILKSSTDAIFIYGDMKFIYLNQNGLDMLEFDNIEKAIEKPILNYIHPDFHEAVKSRVKESHEKESSVGLFEEKFITSKGKEIDVEIQMTYIPYNNKKCNVAFVRNITERKKMEKQLKKSEEYFRKLFNNVSDAIYLNKLDENGLPSVYIEVNDIACSRLGYSREELSKITPFMTNPTIDLGRAKYLVDQLTKRGNVIYEGIAKRKDGEMSPVEINSIFLVLNNEKFILSISRDISERKKNEKALQEREMRYRQLIEAVPYGLYIRHKNKFLFSNKVGLEYMGLSSLDELKNKSFSSIFQPHPQYENDFKRNKELVRKNGFMPLTEEKFIRLSDNVVIDMEAIVTKHNYDESDDTYLVVVRDISDRKNTEALLHDMNEKTKLLEQAAQYEKLRTEFFANLSHELRTPVTVIFSTLQLLNLNIGKIKKLDNNLQNFIKYNGIMKQNCYRLVRLINNLIDVTKIDSGYLDLNLENVNIVSIVEDITQSVAEYVANKGISLIFDTTIEEKIIACDPDKIERMMLNLISNAVKFTPPGGNLFVNITDKNNGILISVRDTGIGIPRDKQKIIFDRFVQVDKTLTRKNEGSGIGLSLVKSLVDMHKGTIAVKSEGKNGSEFVIELPIYQINESTNNKKTKDFYFQGNVEKINIEFSDIYF
jgi:PAS domain S-box-containing protein